MGKTITRVGWYSHKLEPDTAIMDFSPTRNAADRDEVVEWLIEEEYEIEMAGSWSGYDFTIRLQTSVANGRPVGQWRSSGHTPGVAVCRAVEKLSVGVVTEVRPGPETPKVKE